MPLIPSDVYLGSVIVLFLKYFAATLLQARERFAQRRFRYAEDAACWRGQVGDDTELCQRAQSLLRNDAESQPFYLLFGAAYAWLGLWPPGALLYFTVYPLSRLLHASFLLRARQPHRNRSFALGLVILALLATHVAHALLTQPSPS
jgi:hypothetical protein